MKNLIKEYALATIDKVQEMEIAAKKANLHLCVEIDIARGYASIRIFELDKNNNIITEGAFHKNFYRVDKSVSSARDFADTLEEAEDYIANYKANVRAVLEKKQAELMAKLDEVNKDLRKVRKEEE